MDPVILISTNPTLRQIADTAPPEWTRVTWSTAQYFDFAPNQTVIALCEEKGFENLPKKNAVAIFMDSVRQPPGKLQTLGVPVVTLDAPQPGCHFLWTPVDGSLFKPRPWEERSGVICPVRLSGYTCRTKLIHEIQRIGVTLIERDDTARSYAQYIDSLCSAKAVVNLCADRKTGKPQLKGRVFETLAAGALLLEEKNPWTAEWLEDYLEWTTLYDLRRFVESLDLRPTIEKTIAKSGHRSFTEQFDAPIFWREVRKLAA